MAGCRSCQKGGNAGETMGGSPQLTGGTEGMDAGAGSLPNDMKMPEGMAAGGSLQGAAGVDATAQPPVMQGGGKNHNMIGGNAYGDKPPMNGGGCGSCGGSSCKGKHKKGGMLQEAAAPVVLTLAAASPKVRRTLSLGLLQKGGKKSRKVKGKGKGKGKKTKGKKQQKKGKKTRKYHKRR